MNKYKILGLTLLLTFGATANAQHKSKAESVNKGQIVMTKEELKSFLKMVAEKRLEQLKKMDEKVVDYSADADWATVERVKTNSRGCCAKPKQGGDLSYQVQRVNDRLDNLMIALIGKGGANTTLLSPGAAGNQYLDGASTDGQISALEKKIDSLKALQSGLDNNTATKVYISPERRSVLEELLAKYKNFKRQVFFANDSYAVSKEDLAYIDNVVRVLKQNPELSVVLVGYASTVGSQDYNKQLSMKRSEAVASSITSRGISKDRIISGFYGEDEKSSEAKARRVDMTVVIK